MTSSYLPRGSRSRWPSVEQLRRLTIFEITWTLPEDEYMEETDYLGDWRTNGKGDVGGFSGPAGEKLVKLSVPKVW